MAHQRAAQDAGTGQERCHRRRSDRTESPSARGSTLAPALQPELVRAKGLLDSTRDQEVRDRAKTIVRLRAVWAGVDPVAEAAASKLAEPDRVRQLRQIMLSGGLIAQTAQRTIQMLAARIAQHNQRIEHLHSQIATLLGEHGNPVAAIHRIVLTQARCHPQARNYIARKTWVPQLMSRSTTRKPRFCGQNMVLCGVEACI